MRFIHLVMLGFAALHLTGAYNPLVAEVQASVQHQQAVEQMLSQVKGIVNRFPPGTSNEAAVPEFMGIINQYFQMDTIAMSIMGRHWAAFKGKETQFYEALKRKLASIAADHFQKYHGYDFKINRSAGNNVYVSLSKDNESASGLNVSIQVNGSSKIEEISFEGVTIIGALSGDWQSFFTNQCNGSVDTFLASVH